MSATIGHGEKWTVTGVVTEVTGDTVTLTRQLCEYKAPSLKTGDLVKIVSGAPAVVGKIHKIERFSFVGCQQVVHLESVGVHMWWWELCPLTNDEKAAYEAEIAKQKRDTWRAQVSEIPTEVLLDVIKERTKSQ